MNGVDAGEVVVKIISGLHDGICINHHDVSHILIVKVGNWIWKRYSLSVHLILSL